jgi:hypothetical protein
MLPGRLAGARKVSRPKPKSNIPLFSTETKHLVQSKNTPSLKNLLASYSEAKIGNRPSRIDKRVVISSSEVEDGSDGEQSDDVQPAPSNNKPTKVRFFSILIYLEFANFTSLETSFIESIEEAI